MIKQSSTSERSPLTEFDKAVIYVSMKEREIDREIEKLSEYKDNSPEYKRQIKRITWMKCELSTLQRKAREIEERDIASLI